MTLYFTFDRTHEQAAIALECLEKALHKYQAEPNAASLATRLLPYLVHATVLFFLNRDQQAFQTIHDSPLYRKLSLGERLRQLPTLAQLQAVLNSRKNDPGWQTLDAEERGHVQALQQWSDAALGIQDLKAFRDQLLINGVPPEGSPEASPFSVPAFNYVALSQAAITAWKKLNP